MPGAEMKWLVVVIGMLCCGASFGLMRVESCYEYNFSDKESTYEAKQICLNMAMRKAVETNMVFIQSSSVIADYKLKEDLISSNTAGFLKNMKIVKEEVVGNRVTTCIEAQLDTVQIEQKVKTTVRNSITGAQAIKENEYVSILSAVAVGYGDHEKLLEITFKVKNNFFGLTESQFYNAISYSQPFTIYWTIYDVEKPITGGKRVLEAHNLVEGEVRTQEIEIELCKFCTFEWNLGSPPK